MQTTMTDRSLQSTRGCLRLSIASTWDGVDIGPSERVTMQLELLADELVLRGTVSPVAGGREHFLELVTGDDRIAGFLRLHLPDPRRPGSEVLEEIADSALIRELHVYGQAVALGRPGRAAAQHRGLGRRLLAEAWRRARAAGFADLAVVSAVGTRGYYRERGFRDGALYQHRTA